jgi:GTPase
MTLTVAIVGRPNVGKSTLFNRLAGRRLALVDDTPGVTRDRREGEASLAGLGFRIIDTAGLEAESDEAALAGRIQAQTARALDGADVALFLIDARAGVTPLDRHFAAWLRRSGKPVILVANKAEGSLGRSGALEAHDLGLGTPLALSAAHGEGLADLYEALAAHAAPEAAPASGAAEPRPLQLAIIGRPNVGKSTLVNRLLGEDRMIAGPEPGITRDAIASAWQWRDRAVRLIDTAGMRRRPRIAERLEQLSVADTLRAIRFAEVVVLVIDATQMLERQDLGLARLVAEEGRALVLAVNKWDLVDDKALAAARLKDTLAQALPQLAGLRAVTLSALTGAGLARLMPAVIAAEAAWNKRVPTPRLNRFLAEAQERHPPPLVAGRRLRLRYMTQANVRPPTFALFASKPGELPESWRRYLVNLLRETFELQGVPIRVMLRKGKNPYADA